MAWNLSLVEREKGEEEVKSRKKSLGSKFRWNRGRWCEEENDSEESEDQGSGKYNN